MRKMMFQYQFLRGSRLTLKITKFHQKYGFLYTETTAILVASEKKRVSELVGIWAILQSEIQLIIRLWRAVKASENGVDLSLSLTVAGLISTKNALEIKHRNSSLLGSYYPNFKNLEQRILEELNRLRQLEKSIEQTLTLIQS